jgi:predicted ferric reductase
MLPRAGEYFARTSGIQTYSVGCQGWQRVFSLKGNTIHPKPEQVMRSLLYIIAVLLVIGWLIGVVGYSAGGLIHILLVIALVSLLLTFIRRGTV